MGISLGVVSLALAAILGKMLYDRRAKKDVSPSEQVLLHAYYPAEVRFLVRDISVLDDRKEP